MELLHEERPSGCIIMRHIGFILFFCMGFLTSGVAYGQQACRDIFQSASSELPPVPLFREHQPVLLKLKSNFSKIEISSDNERLKEMKRSYPATVTWSDGRVVKAKAKAFGDSASNNDEATFRKLHITLEDGMEVYIGTHVQTHPTEKWTPQGRITDGTSPFREALIYDIAKALDVPTPAHRRAMIEYTNVDTNETFTKPALLIENLKETAQRRGAKLVSEQVLDEKKSTTPVGSENFSVPESIRIYLFQILIGNSDFALEIYNTRRPRSMEYSDIKNVAITQNATKGSLKPIVYDFDIASMVAGYEINTPAKPWAQLPEITPDPVTASMFRGLLALRMSVKESDLRDEIAKILKNRHQLRDAISQAVVDPQGRILAFDHMKHFFEAIQLAWRKDIQFVKTPGQRLYPAADSKGSALKPIKTPPWGVMKPRSMRQGSPFLILGEQGDFLKVFFIDPQYELKSYKNHVGYIKKSVEYSNQLADSEVPFLEKK